ncbi:MAG TPA: NAD-dependent epimerase/dehydratase family protein [Planctomycetota bacterium]|nr:NAD-dependent epimerase/dehydratase family protein [Planctomycetota bacterium]
MKRFFITGGCGFFGTWIIKRLLDDGDHVTVFDVQRNTKRWEMILSAAEIERVEFRSGRIDETDSFITTVKECRPDAIIHLAGLQVPTCRENPVLGAKVNVIGTLNVFEAARALLAEGKALPKLVYASSAAVFGPDAEYGEKAVGDMATPKPSSHYGAYKLCNENSAKAYWLAYKTPSVGFRPLTVYGPGRDTGMTSFPTRAMAAAVKGQAFDIPFSGPTAYIHMREVADMFVQSARANVADAKVYTVGGDIVDTRTFIAEVEKVLPGAAKLITCSGGDLPVASKVDDAVLRADYPGLLRIPLAQGIRETVDVFKKLHARGALEV